MLLKAETHYFVFLYECLQHSRDLRMLHCVLVIKWQAVSHLELVVTQNLLLVGWILHISEQGLAGVDKAAECAAAGRG